MSSRIVVIEDEQAIRRGVVDALRHSGYEPIEAADGPSGEKAALDDRVDLILLDLLLPGKSGFDILAAIRRVHPTRPVIILTARGDEDDRVRGLKMGADDYVVKPYSARELLARVEAVLRRSAPPEPNLRISLGDGVIDLDRREVRWPKLNVRFELSETETELLKYLLRNPARAVSREELLEGVWGIHGGHIETRTIDMHVVRLRSKLRDPSGNGEAEVIATVRGVGYMAGAGLLGEART